MKLTWLMAATTTWLMVGLFLDGWAHQHIAGLESFFTPWHAVFYSGFAAISLTIIGAILKHKQSKNEILRISLPGLKFSFFGMIIFLAGAILDMIWHLVFGVEVNVEALLSPTHLILATGFFCILLGFLTYTLSQKLTTSFFSNLPILIIFTYLLSLFTFLTQYANPFVHTWSALSATGLQYVKDPLLPHSLGVVSIIFQTAIVSSIMLFLLKVIKPPFGAFTFIFTINMIFMSFMKDQYRFIPAFFACGLTADLLVYSLKVSYSNIRSVRIFAFLVPTLLYTLYFLALSLTDQIWWSIHLWAGVIFLAGITGLFVSYLLLPPKELLIRSED